MPGVTYEKNPVDDAKTSDNSSHYVISNEAHINEIKRVFKIDNALSKDPYNPNFDLKISNREEYVPKVGK